jgi:uncharacterized protein YidB (DUF937 family)
MALRGLALALLGLLAYQNRDKIGALLRGETQPGEPNNSQEVGGVIDNLIDGSGLREVLDRFRNSGSSEQVDSWVGLGENEPLQRDQVERAIDPETLDELSRQTGLRREELLYRITRDLPVAVDRATPTGQLPLEEDSASGPNLLDDVPPTPSRT